MYLEQNRCAKGLFTLVVLVASGLVSFGSESLKGYPETPAREVVLEYGTVRLADSFSWLEDKESEEVEDWFHAQNDFTRGHIGEMPGRDELYERIKEIDEAKTVQIHTFSRSLERYFFMKREVGQEVALLHYRDGVDGEAKLIVDPADLGTGEGVYSINHYSPSYDGDKVVVSIAASGSEIPDIYLMDVETGEILEDPITRVRSNANWKEDGSGYFYTQLRPEDPDQEQVDRYKRQMVKYHELGTDAAHDPIVVSYDKHPTPGLTPVDGPYVFPLPGTSYTVALISHGVDRANSYFFTREFDPDAAGDTEWITICQKEDRIESVDYRDDTLFLLSSKEAPRRKILKVDLKDFSKDNFEVLLPEGDRVLTGVTALGDRLYVTGMDGGIDFLMTLDLTNPDAEFEMVELPLIGRVTMLNNDHRKDDMYISLTSWTRSSAYYRYDPADGSVTLSKLRPLGPFDAPEGLVTRRVMVKSHDAVEVPLTIIHHESVELDGTNPTILYGYGAYGISQKPAFGSMLLAWLERGGIHAVAHVRGGGEFGKEWHEGGHLESKRNSWLDFNACAEYLIENDYTASAYIGAMGGSMGGVLVGRAMTSRPDLYGAVVSVVGNHNPVRNHRRANGPANYPEYGNPLDPEEFPYVLAMDSYFAVKDGVTYPPTLLMSGYNDSRVDPWMPGKMAARLQQADPEGGPFFMRVDFEAGHGGVARSDIWEAQADRYAFLFWALQGSDN